MKLKRLKLRKNNWESETYEFDELLTEFSSQKRVYEVVAKPVVEVYETRSFSLLWSNLSVLCFSQFEVVINSGCILRAANIFNATFSFP